METPDTKVAFSIPATLTFEDEKMSEEDAIEKLVEWWDDASTEERLSVIVGDGATLAENIIYIDHKYEDGQDDIIAQY